MEREDYIPDQPYVVGSDGQSEIVQTNEVPPISGDVKKVADAIGVVSMETALGLEPYKNNGWKVKLVRPPEEPDIYQPVKVRRMHNKALFE